MKLIRVKHPVPGMQIVYSEDGHKIFTLKNKSFEYWGTILDPMEDKYDTHRIRVRWAWHEGTEDMGSVPIHCMYYPPSYCGECGNPKTDPNDYLCGECRGLID
jgi:hypothetical protein